MLDMTGKDNARTVNLVIHIRCAHCVSVSLSPVWAIIREL
jgi:hypothetical protein